jgi:hypothetical protein
VIIVCPSKPTLLLFSLAALLIHKEEMRKRGATATIAGAFGGSGSSSGAGLPFIRPGPIPLDAKRRELSRFVGGASSNSMS